jgi:hypothetical protein
MRTLRVAGLQKVAEGVTTLEEAVSMTAFGLGKIYGKDTSTALLKTIG